MVRVIVFATHLFNWCALTVSSTIIFLFTVGTAILYLPSIAQSASCDAVVGKWAWFVGGEVTIKPDGTFTQQSGNSGIWECTDASKRTVTLKWTKGGFVNKMALSADGTNLSSTDPSQSFVKATRVNPETALTDLLAPRQAMNVDSPSSSRRPTGQPGGTVPIKPSTPVTPKKGPLPYDSPQGFVHSDPKVEARFKQGYDLYTRKSYAAAFPILLETAQAGHPRAQAVLGIIYSQGRGQAVDSKQAAMWYGKAAAQGHRAAQFSLGNLYLEGDGVPKDQAKAVQLYRQSADQGFPHAEFHLGLAYEFGWGGLPRDRRTAIKWLDRASRHKHGQAGWIVGWLEDPKTPHFRDVEQLGSYIGGIIDRRAAAAFEGGGGGDGGNPCSSYSGPVAEACNRGDGGAMDRYQKNQPTQEDRRQYGAPDRVY
jgi:hypothetical protein